MPRTRPVRSDPMQPLHTGWPCCGANGANMTVAGHAAVHTELRTPPGIASARAPRTPRTTHRTASTGARCRQPGPSACGALRRGQAPRTAPDPGSACLGATVPLRGCHARAQSARSGQRRRHPGAGGGGWQRRPHAVPFPPRLVPSSTLPAAHRRWRSEGFISAFAQAQRLAPGSRYSGRRWGPDAFACAPAPLRSRFWEPQPARLLTQPCRRPGALSRAASPFCQVTCFIAVVPAAYGRMENRVNARAARSCGACCRCGACGRGSRAGITLPTPALYVCTTCTRRPLTDR